jgi:hypothetical protein
MNPTTWYRYSYPFFYLFLPAVFMNIHPRGTLVTPYIFSTNYCLLLWLLVSSYSLRTSDSPLSQQPELFSLLFFTCRQTTVLSLETLHYLVNPHSSYYSLSTVFCSNPLNRFPSSRLPTFQAYPFLITRFFPVLHGQPPLMKPPLRYYRFHTFRAR